MKKTIALCALFISLQASAGILVVEYKSDDASFKHANHVEHIACANLFEAYCQILYTKVYLEEFINEFNNKVSDKKVVNMSFGYYEPLDSIYGGGKSSMINPAKAEQGLKDFHKQNDNFLNLFSQHSDKLFTIAAGNGHPVVGLLSVPLGDMYPAYPNMYNADNVMKVAAVEDGNVFKLADYSNYSLWNVDIAAVVERGVDNRYIEGTSFSAPSVAKMANKILEAYPSIKSTELKEIFMKSVYIKDITAAIDVTKDFLINQDRSFAFRVHNRFHYGQREEIRAEVKDVILVKSGGIANFETALSCAKFFQESMSIEDACLKSQSIHFERSQEELNQLSQLWNIRNI